MRSSTGKRYNTAKEWWKTYNMDSIVLCCPLCDILITVKVEDCIEGHDFPCPICGKNICFRFTKEELEKMEEITKVNQQRVFRRQFPLAFGDR